MGGDLLRGIEYPLFGGMGAIVGGLVCLLMIPFALFWPAVWSFMWIPPVAGTAIGLIVAIGAK